MKQATKKPTAKQSKAKPKAKPKPKPKPKPKTKAAKRPTAKPKARKLPPPASRPAWMQDAAAARVIELSPGWRRTLAMVRYQQLTDWRTDPPGFPDASKAAVRIDLQRVEDALRNLGPLPDELIAAWAAAGDRVQSADTESFTPESAIGATDLANDLEEKLAPEGFVALRSTGERGGYEALLNEALGGSSQEPAVVYVLFDRLDGRIEIRSPQPLAEWLVDRYLVELELTLPAAFLAAFQVTID